MRYLKYIGQLIVFSSLIAISSITTSAPLNMWQALPKTFHLSEHFEHPNVQKQIKRFMARPYQLHELVIQSEPYVYYVYQQVKQRGMPGELVLLPKIESAYDPYAVSGVGAAGLWQLMPVTAQSLGLVLDWWYDGRRDIQASTHAALNYFVYLKERFDDDWLLAIAAYHSGEGNVAKAIRRNKSQGKPTDFWSLPLPRSTQAYVPKFLALAAIVHNPRKYGTELPKIPYRPYFTEINVDGQLTLAAIAELADLNLDEIYRLNPGHNQGITSPNHSQRVILPITQVKTFTKNFAQYVKESESTQAEEPAVAALNHEVKSGDTLGAIARQYQVSVTAIQQLNNLRNHVIRPGQVLMIAGHAQLAHPSANHTSKLSKRRARAIAKSPKPKSNLQRTTHTVRTDDTLKSIARKYKITENALRLWNQIPNGKSPRAGTELVILTGQPDVARLNSYYRVRAGDTLSHIAKRHGVRVSDLQRWNPQVKQSGVIRPGQRLRVRA
ncbi:MAG: LysM peptidoglycan-binding domain-containing protein [Legionellales bacterium]|nr:LysM peptidoglycan-binding domain-containing protein [Legionellales bacterium]